MHNSTAAMKNMPMTLIVSITKLKTLFSIIVLIYFRVHFQFQRKNTPSKRHYTSEALKKCKIILKTLNPPSIYHASFF